MSNIGLNSSNWTNDHPFGLEKYPLPDDVVYQDVRITMRDGVALAASVYRPAVSNPVPAITTATPYGKDNFDQWTFFKDAPEGNLPAGSGFYMGNFEISDHTPFEAPDPGFWVPRGYAVVLVDHPGLGASGSSASPPPMQERWEDIMAWVGSQTWCSGSIGMLGVSALCCTQWVASETPAPTELKAIIPWEGFNATGPGNGCGGIPESALLPWVGQVWIGPNINPDGKGPEPALTDWTYACDRIQVPALVCASTSDQELHSWDTFDAYTKITTPSKWLISHRRPKWEMFYGPEQQALQSRFFDRFLKGDAEAFNNISKVAIDVHDSRLNWKTRRAASWPVPGTLLQTFYPCATDGDLKAAPGQSSGFMLTSRELNQRSSRVTFELRFDHTVEIVGHGALYLSAIATVAPRIDFFIGIEKLDSAGNEVFFFSASGGNANGPVTRGWLRSDYRKIDPALSSEGRPVRINEDCGSLTEGQRVDFSIPLMPTAVRFRAGESLRLAIQTWSEPGRWDGGEGRVWQTDPNGECRILSGEGTTTRLVLPVIPESAWDQDSAAEMTA